MQQMALRCLTWVQGHDPHAGGQSGAPSHNGTQLLLQTHKSAETIEARPEPTALGAVEIDGVMRDLATANPATAM